MRTIFFSLAAASVIAIAASATPASAQAGCSPYTGGSCGYQDTHPPVAWHRQNPYYNGRGGQQGNIGGGVRGGYGQRGGYGNGAGGAVAQQRLVVYRWQNVTVNSFCNRHVKHCINGVCEEFDKACD